MAPDWIPLCIPRGAIGGGFTSRILWVVATKKEKVIPDPEQFPKDEALEYGIIHDLERISMINGEYKFTDEAKAAYVKWYSEEEAKIQLGNSPIADPRFSGYISRRATHIKKISMALAAAQRDLRELSLDDFTLALEYLEDIEKDMGDVFARVGLSPQAIQSADITEFIQARGKVWKSQILRYFKSDLDTRTFDSVVSYLTSTGEVRIVTIDSAKGDVMYEWKG
jgi:hypothetical protein